MARTVTDAAVLLDALVGYDPKDPYTAAYAIAGHKGSYTRHLDRDGLKGARIGVLTQAFGSDDDPDAGQVNALVRGGDQADRGVGGRDRRGRLPNLMDFIVETSL